jgi:hypothetical protein
VGAWGALGRPGGEPGGGRTGAGGSRARRRAGLLAVLVAVLVVGVTAGAARARPGIWISPTEIHRLPERGAAWGQLVELANEPMGHADLSDQNSAHDVRVLAAALVYARTGEERLRRKAIAGVMDAIGTEEGGRTLALARGLVAYVIAADLVDLRRDGARARVFAQWLAKVRNERLEPESRPTLVLTHERAPNNWGTHAGASRIAADVYLGDRRDLARAASVFKGYLGDRRVYRGFAFGDDASWQARSGAPVGVNPAGAMKDGQWIDGALPDDMRRGCSLRFPPCPTLYPWEAMQGAVVQAELVSRQGYDAWNWGHQALRRAAAFLFSLHWRYGAAQWGAPAGDAWIPWLLNARYGTAFPTTSPARPGKGMGFTDWTAARRCPGDACTAPLGPGRAVRPVAARPTPDTQSDADDDVSAVAVVVLGAGLLAALAVVGLRRMARPGRARGPPKQVKSRRAP